MEYNEEFKTDLVPDDESIINQEEYKSHLDNLKLKQEEHRKFVLDQERKHRA